MTSNSRRPDVIVIGAGVIGCAVAYELARRGASVEIIDERPVAMGATQASAGILAPFLEAKEGSVLLDLTVRSLDLYDEFIERLSSDSGVSVPYHRTGTLDVATNDAELNALRATAVVLARRGVPALMLDAATVRSEEPHLDDSVIGGLLIDTHGFVAAAEMTRALVAGARHHGAQLIEQSPVRRITRRGDDLTVQTERGSLTASAVVLAAGSWSGTIAIDGVTGRVPVRPVRGQLLWLDWSGPSLRRVTWSRRCYMVPWDDGTLLVGATVEEVGFDERATVAGVKGLLDAVCATVPHAAASAFRAARVGLRPASADDLPVVGASTMLPGLMYATGHYRNGVLLAPLTAQLVADAVLDGRIDPALATIAPSRFGAL